MWPYIELQVDNIVLVNRLKCGVNDCTSEPQERSSITKRCALRHSGSLLTDVVSGVLHHFLMYYVVKSPITCWNIIILHNMAFLFVGGTLGSGQCILCTCVKVSYLKPCQPQAEHARFRFSRQKGVAVILQHKCKYIQGYSNEVVIL